MKLKDFEFLLDENVDHRLADLFNRYDISFTTVQKQGWIGFSDKNLCPLIREKNNVLITRDKDFNYLWKPHQIGVIYISIKPLNLENIKMRLEALFDQSIEIEIPFLIILQLENIRIKK